jgi:hypothetical protein
MFSDFVEDEGAVIRWHHGGEISGDFDGDTIRFGRMKEMSSYEILVHELFHYWNRQNDHYGAMRAIQALAADSLGDYSMLYEEVLANWAALGSLRRSVLLTTEITYAPIFKKLKDAGRIPADLMKEEPEKWAEFFRQKSMEERALFIAAANKGYAKYGADYISELSSVIYRWSRGDTLRSATNAWHQSGKLPKVSDADVDALVEEMAKRLNIVPTAR